MRRFAKVVPILFAAALFGLGTAQGQDEDYYEDEGYGGARENKFAVGFGVGIVDTDLDSDILFAVDFRIKLGGRGEGQLEEGIIGYIEPEIGYWSMADEFGEVTADYSDLHIGVGLTGVIPTRAADLFMNVGLDLHSFTADVSREGIRADDDETSLGGHAKVGLDLYVGDNFSLMGQGGYYLVDTDIPVFENQLKVWVGGRLGF